MLIPGRSFTYTTVRHALIWLLAWLLPMQAMASGVFSVLGPAHFHKPSEAQVVLTDFRRWHPAPARQAPAFAISGHSHGAAATQRHHHAGGDPSVVRTAQDGPMNSPDVDDNPSAAASLASVLAMLAHWLPFEPSRPGGVLASHSAWALLTGFDEPPDRPPMRG